MFDASDVLLLRVGEYLTAVHNKSSLRFVDLGLSCISNTHSTAVSRGRKVCSISQTMKLRLIIYKGNV